jgi:hypothetical protein
MIQGRGDRALLADRGLALARLWGEEGTARCLQPPTKASKAHSLVQFTRKTSKWCVTVSTRGFKSTTNIETADALVGFSMLVAATGIFIYYTLWAIVMVRLHPRLGYSMDELTY